MILLEFERQPVRLLVAGQQIWCASADLAAVLGQSVTALLGGVEADEQMKLPTENGAEELVWVNEWGIYTLMTNFGNALIQRWKQWWLREVMPSVRASYAPSTPTITAKEAIDLAIPILKDLGISPERLGTWILEKYRRIYPAHTDIFVDLRTTIVEDTPPSVPAPLAPTPSRQADTSSHRLSPTELGQLIAQKYRLGFTPSPQKINQALARLDLQILAPVRNGKEWKLTKAGNQYGRLENCVDRHNKNRIQIRWSPEVAPIVAQELGLI